MLTFESGDDRYEIRHVPLQEAQALQRDGVKMYDYTALTAIDTCPTWGVLRYGLHLTDTPMSEGGRRMALECGHACHEYYAALRMWTLLQRIEDVGDLMVHADKVLAHGSRLFRDERWTSMLDIPQDSDPMNNATRFALEALHTTGYYDDPNDRRRTMSNMEVACMAYTDRYFQSDMPVLVRDDFIGVEVPFVLEVTLMRKGLIGKSSWFSIAKAYYCGRIDGVHTYGDDIVTAENKTASRLSDSWRMSFAISQQITGYGIAATAMLGTEVVNGFVMGMQIPPTRNVYDGVAFEYVTRTESDRLRWCEWFFEGVEKYERWCVAPTHAPRYSHSCNRYFSACQFIPYCASTREEQRELIRQMRKDEWSPLDHLAEKAIEGN